MAAAPRNKANTAAPQTNPVKKTAVRKANSNAMAPKAKEPIPVPKDTHFIHSKLATAGDVLKTSLLILSIWYEDPRIQAKQHEQLTNLLDRIAGSVIYSRKHLIEPAYRVRQGESLQQIALVHKIPEGLLRKINQIENRAVISPGQELKVVRGPFNATINSKKKQLTLWLGGRYAGRFALILGPEFEQIVGPFVVQDKTRMHRNHDNQPWIQLGPGYGLGAAPVSSGPQLGIAGMVNTARAIPGDRPGRIGVSSRDADDLFDILSQGSKVTIRR